MKEWISSLLLSLSNNYALVLLGVVFVVVSMIYVLLPGASHKDEHNKLEHAVITGGSSGIGKSMAHECLKRGVKQVTLIARDPTKLDQTKQKLVSEYPSARVHTVSLDVTDSRAVQSEMTKLVETHGPPTLLLNNAGTSFAGTFVDTPLSDFESLMQLNYFGSVYITKALLPLMLKNDSSSKTIVFVSSIAGQVGVFGYTAYSATKAAPILLAQVLQAELRPHNVSVMLAFPPDTDTPGYELEQAADKPLETQLVSETAGLFEPDAVANRIVTAALSRKPPFCVYFGLEGWMVATLTAGMSPVSDLYNALCQVFLMGLLRFVSLFYLYDWERIIRKCHVEKQQQKPKKE